MLPANLSVTDQYFISQIIQYNLSNLNWKFQNSNQSCACTARIPSCIHLDLLACGLIPDPYVGDNDVRLRWVALDKWTYSTTFRLQSPSQTKKKKLLFFYGLDTIAQISLNGIPLKRAENMHLSSTVDLSNVLTRGINQLEIAFSSPVLEAKKLSDEYELAYGYDIPPKCPPAIQNGDCHVNFIRKTASSFSWDWAPSFPTVGIYKPARLFLYDCCIILHFSVLPKLNASDQMWHLHVEFELNCASSANVTAIVTLESFNWTWQSPVTAGVNHLDQVFTIPDISVERWWPYGYGKQRLYQVVGRTDCGTERDVKTIQIGFRTVALSELPAPAAAGNLFHFEVNGIPLFLKGANWVPVDSFLPRVSNDRLQFLLESSQQANMNCLRVWGGGAYESDFFYEEADRRGILIWQDLMFAVALYPVNGAFLDSVGQEIAFQLGRLKHHPSIFVWSANNENELGINHWFHGTANKSTYYSDYLTLYKDLVGDIVSKVDLQSRPFVLSSPSNGVQTIKEGGISSNPNSEFYGDMHYYTLRDMWISYLHPIARCISEFGLQSLPFVETLQTAGFKDDDLSFHSQSLLHRQHHPTAHESMAFNVRAHFRLMEYDGGSLTNSSKPDGSELWRWVFLTQLYQAIAYKTMVEHWRRWRNRFDRSGRGHTMCALYWQLNDIWQAPSWSTIDYSLKWKVAHYYARHFFAPLLLSAECYFNHSCDIYAISDLVKPVKNVRLSVHFLKWGSFLPGCSLHTTLPVIQPLSSLAVFNFDKTICDLSNFDILSLHLQGNQNDASNVHLFSDLRNVSADKLGNIKSVLIDAGKQERHFQVSLLASQPVAFVWLDVSNVTGYFSDNGFIMLQSKLTVTFFAKNVNDLSIIKDKLTVLTLSDVQEPLNAPHTGSLLYFVVAVFCRAAAMVVQHYQSISFLDVVNSWSEEDVVSWLRGLDDVVTPYLQVFTSSSINGRKLLLLSSVDLIDMGITNLHALRTFINAIQLLINLCFEIDSENLQCIALQLSAKSRNLMHDLGCLVTPKGSKRFEWEVLPNSILSELSCLAEQTKKMVSWLDRSPFSADSSYHQIRDTILHLVERSNVGTLKWRLFSSFGLFAAFQCTQLCAICDRIVEESRDPLGFNIEAPYKGMHSISEVKFRSPADFCGRLMAGDEIVQVNEHTVIGWQLNFISELLLSCETLEVSLLLKKRPRQHDGIVKSLTANVKYPTTVDVPPTLTIHPLKKRRRSSSLGVLHVSFAELSLNHNDVEKHADEWTNSISPNCRQLDPRSLSTNSSLMKPFDRRRATFSVDELREAHSFALNSNVPLRKGNSALVEDASSTSDLSQLNLDLFIEQYNECHRESCIVERVPFVWDQGIYAEVELADQTSLLEEGIAVDSFCSPEWHLSSKSVQFYQDHSFDNGDVSSQHFKEDREGKCLSETECSCSPSAADVESPRLFSGQTMPSDDECSSSMSMSFQSSCTTPLYPRSHSKLRKFFGESFDFPEARWYFEANDRSENCSAPVLSPPKVYAGVTLEGWAYQAKIDCKRSRHSNHKWVKRWLVLKGFFLYVYLNSESYQPELVVRLSNCRVSPPGPELKTRKINVFKVQNEDTNLYFRCEQRCEMLLWLKRLGLAAIGYTG
ncbi:hypothetical protein M514_03652 [Trichuris suis]|uniref:beta-mannosidase n=1 Tax=Trichuris suis TaxID=68888 RepID=A0A085N066_9BILA|nr:hypothetical protein M514_03652 [Trichuris suis]